MQLNSMKQQDTVAVRLRPVAYVYVAINLAVVALLVSTVSPTLATAPAHATGSQEMASLR
ncbi:hypothetical protein MUO32_14270 [Shinella sp. CPCC 101442]|uniref:hypothetical protein n=1 Tax=Shinella sp. CPCC 101442 TaxID=2932265 RepID=UPI00215347D5|nr:hypothetical protein [Shinella sp. CPCC 101442]MCR6500211.1 hypothetical protein [Shinella sp. CPCC 101442]